MNRLLVLCFVVAVSVSEGYAASIRNKRQVIPREFQNINIENYLKNERAVRFQLKCIIDDGPCDRIGKYLKVTIPELLVNQCANCDMAQRERAGKLVSHIQQNFPEEWERAVKKFQGGKVKAEDAEKLQSILGIKLNPNLVAEPTSTAAPVTTPAAKAVEVPSTSEVPVSSSSAAPVAVSSSSEAPASSSAAPVPEATSAASVAPVESTSMAAAVSEASSTVAAAAVSSTSESAAVVSTSEAAVPASSTAAAAAPSSSAAPVA